LVAVVGSGAEILTGDFIVIRNSTLRAVGGNSDYMVGSGFLRNPDIPPIPAMVLQVIFSRIIPDWEGRNTRG